MSDTRGRDDGAAREPGGAAAAPPDGRVSAAAPSEPGGFDTPPAAAEPGGQELVRDSERGLLTGVCAGLGAYTRIDPIVWRVGFAITGLAGFAGVLLYVCAWMAMRDAGRGPAMVEQLLNRRVDERAVPALLGLGLAISAALSLIGGVSWGTLVLATPLILGVLVAHNRGVDLRRTYRELPKLLKSGEPPPSTPAPEPTTPTYYNPAQPWAQAPSGPVDLAVVGDQKNPRSVRGADAADTDTAHAGTGSAKHEEAAEGDEDGRAGTAGHGGEYGPPPGTKNAGLREGPRASRERRRQRRRDRRADCGVPLSSIVSWAVVAAAAITIGATSTSFVQALFGPQTGPVFLGSVVVMIGVAAVVGAWFGDPRGLMTSGAVAVLLLVGTAVVDVSTLRFGAMDWRPASVAAVQDRYTLTGGDARLDLTRLPLDPGERVEVAADVQFGQLTVLVPSNARVLVQGTVSVGGLHIGDTVQTGTALDTNRTLAPASAAHSPGGGEPGPSAEGAGGAGGADAAGDDRPAGGAQRQEPGAEADPPTLVVDLASTIGGMEVRRAAP